MKPYPTWVCMECALENGGHRIPNHASTIHLGPCDLCHIVKYVTEPRDFGHLPKLLPKRERNRRIVAS